MAISTVTRTISGLPSQAPHLRHWLQDVLTTWDIPADVTADLLLAVTELCTNIIKHGYDETHTGDITFQVTRDHHALYLTLRDTAAIFVPAHVPTVPPEELAEDGYGLFLVNALVDEVIYEPAETGGNCVRLVKYTGP